MAPTKQFKYFARLPRELQYMIWDFFWQSRDGLIHWFRCTWNRGPIGDREMIDLQLIPYTHIAYRPGKAVVDTRQEALEFVKLGATLPSRYKTKDLRIKVWTVGPDGLSSGRKTRYLQIDEERDIFVFDSAEIIFLSPMIRRLIPRLGPQHVAFPIETYEKVHFHRGMGRRLTSRSRLQFKSIKQVTVLSDQQYFLGHHSGGFGRDRPSIFFCAHENSSALGWDLDLHEVSEQCAELEWIDQEMTMWKNNLDVSVSLSATVDLENRLRPLKAFIHALEKETQPSYAKE
ncbi:hypothetical protein F5B20DRAFT_578119 [Whalleya microplaca]|nr:hypothetical protein F5B20DRAFT_578119 [Whalleya microplaca]